MSKTTPRMPQDMFRHIRVDVPQGDYWTQAYCPKCRDESLDILHADFCPAPAFAALLAVAKAFEWAESGGDVCPVCITFREDGAHQVECPVAQLDTQHPGWREWTP